MRDSLLIARAGVLLGLLMIAMVASHALFSDSLHAFFLSRQPHLEGVLVALLTFLGLASDVVLPVPSSVLSVWAFTAHGIVTGFLVVWSGMMLACIVGYWLGAVAGKAVTQRFVKSRDMNSANALYNRYGSAALIVCRAVPVLAEASVIAAGASSLPWRRFLVVCALANAGISLAYAMAVFWAEASASITMVFVASVSVPLVFLAIYKTISMKGKTEATDLSRDEQLLPSFNVQFSYPLCFTRNVFNPSNTTLLNQLHRDTALNTPIKIQAFVDEGVLEAHPQLPQQISAYCSAHRLEQAGEIVVIPGSEAAKTQHQIERMHEQMLAAKLDRQSYVIAIGGGGVLDAVGYAATTFHRGIRLIRMPTTVLAQNDAGVGVKNGINSRGIKNLLGCFSVPHAIINDSLFLESLSSRDFRSGFAEAIKVALIRDAGFYHWIEANLQQLNARQEAATHYLIKRCAELHLNQICRGGDPFEMGSARPLDYGHWSAHKLESLTQHELSHGEAVAIGMALDAQYAVEVSLLSQPTADKIIELIKGLGFAVWHDALAWNAPTGESALLVGLEEFRQHLGGQLCITLLTDIGVTLEANHIETEALLCARDKLRTHAFNTKAQQSG